MNEHRRRTISAAVLTVSLVFPGCSAVHRRPYLTPNGDRATYPPSGGRLSSRADPPRVEVRLGDTKRPLADGRAGDR